MISYVRIGGSRGSGPRPPAALPTVLVPSIAHNCATEVEPIREREVEGRVSEMIESVLRDPLGAGTAKIVVRMFAFAGLPWIFKVAVGIFHSSTIAASAAPHQTNLKVEGDVAHGHG